MSNQYADLIDGKTRGNYEVFCDGERVSRPGHSGNHDDLENALETKAWHQTNAATPGLHEYTITHPVSVYKMRIIELTESMPSIEMSTDTAGTTADPHKSEVSVPPVVGGDVTFTDQGATTLVDTGVMTVTIDNATGLITTGSNSGGVQWSASTLTARSGFNPDAMTNRVFNNSATPVINAALGSILFKRPLVIAGENDLMLLIHYQFFGGSQMMSFRAQTRIQNPPLTYENTWHNAYYRAHVGKVRHKIGSTKALTPKVVAIDSIWSQGESGVGVKYNAENWTNANLKGPWQMTTINGARTAHIRQREDSDSLGGDNGWALRATNLPIGTYTVEYFADVHPTLSGALGTVGFAIDSTAGASEVTAGPSNGTWQTIAGTHTFDANSSIRVRNKYYDSPIGSLYTTFTKFRFTPSGGGTAIEAPIYQVSDTEVNAAPHSMAIPQAKYLSPMELFVESDGFGAEAYTNADEPWTEGSGPWLNMWVSMADETPALLAKALEVPDPSIFTADDPLEINPTTSATRTADLVRWADEVPEHALNISPMHCDMQGWGTDQLQVPYLRFSGSPSTRKERINPDMGSMHYNVPTAFWEFWKATGDPKWYRNWLDHALNLYHVETSSGPGLHAKYRGLGKRKGAPGHPKIDGTLSTANGGDDDSNMYHLHQMRQARETGPVNSNVAETLMHLYEVTGMEDAKEEAWNATDTLVYNGLRDVQERDFWFARRAGRGVTWYMKGLVDGYKYFGVTKFTGDVANPTIAAGTSYLDLMDTITTALVGHYMTDWGNGITGFVGASESGAPGGDSQQPIWVQQLVPILMRIREILIAESRNASLQADILTLVHGTADKLVSSYLVEFEPGKWQFAYKLNDDFSVSEWVRLDYVSSTFKGNLETSFMYAMKTLALSYNLRPNAAVLATATSLFNHCYPRMQAGKGQRLVASAHGMGDVIEVFGL